MAGMKEWECKAERALGCIEGVAFGVSELMRDVILGATEEIDDALKKYREELENLREDYKGQSKFVEILMQQKDGLLHENMELRGKLSGETTQSRKRDSYPCAGEVPTPAPSGHPLPGEGKKERIDTDCEGCGWVST